MSDAFVEVQEQLRQEKLARLWKRYGNALISFILLVVLVTAALAGYRHWDVRQRIDQTDQLYALMNDTAFPANIQDLELDMRPGMQALLYMQAAQAAYSAGDAGQALSFYSRVQALPGDDAALYKGLASLMIARLQPDKTRTVLEPLAVDEASIWRGHALLDLAAYEGGVYQDYDKALSYLQLIQTLPNMSPSLVNKAQALDHVYSQQKAQ